MKAPKTPTPSSNDLVLIEQITNKICQLGLTVPALFLLDAGRPLAFILGQLLWMAQPTINLFNPQNQIRHLATFLEQPNSFSILIAQLEKETE